MSKYSKVYNKRIISKHDVNVTINDRIIPTIRTVNRFVWIRKAKGSKRYFVEVVSIINRHDYGAAKYRYRLLDNISSVFTLEEAEIALATFMLSRTYESPEDIGGT